MTSPVTYLHLQSLLQSFTSYKDRLKNTQTIIVPNFSSGRTACYSVRKTLQAESVLVINERLPCGHL